MRQTTLNGREVVKLRDASTQLAARAANYRLKLNALSRSSGAGIVMFDDRGVVVHANSTAEEILSVETNGLVGHTIAQVTFSRELHDFVLDATTTRQTQTRDVAMPGAQIRILRAAVYPFDVGLSGVPEVMLVLSDVTELRRLETIRRDFVANVSHELRTPLASIRAMAETLQDGALHDPKVAESFLATIVKETNRLERIANDLLILSDAESKLPLRGWFDLQMLLRDLVARSQPHATDSGVSLAIEVSSSLPVFASRDQMEQVIVNLVDNAIKYTPAGGTISVDAGIEDGKIVVSVSDNGLGIKDTDLPRIFERFYRVDKARSRASGGTGLGLSIVKNIVEAHGGEVRVDSKIGRGSTFTILLPNQGETGIR